MALVDRRGFLIGAGSLGATIVAGSPGGVLGEVRPATSRRRPLALIYRGPASCPDCAESVAALLRRSPSRFRTVFCGPSERVALSARALSAATVYAQPGGGDLDAAWRQMRRHAHHIRAFVHRGGHYLGFCLGGYLAGHTPGFGLLPGDSDEYIASPGATVHTTDDTIVAVRWRRHTRHMFFQDGSSFWLRRGASATVLATYTNGLAAAVVARYGAGSVGVVGPHPEADRSWYADARLTNPDGVRFDLGYDLIETTVKRATVPT